MASEIQTEHSYVNTHALPHAINMHAITRTHIHMHVHTYMYTCIHTGMHTVHTHTKVSKCTCTYICV